MQYQYCGSLIFFRIRIRIRIRDALQIVFFISKINSDTDPTVYTNLDSNFIKDSDLL
jgi:hypothetical protein